MILKRKQYQEIKKKILFDYVTEPNKVKIYDDKIDSYHKKYYMTKNIRTFFRYYYLIKDMPESKKIEINYIVRMLMDLKILNSKTNLEDSLFRRVSFNTRYIYKLDEAFDEVDEYVVCDNFKKMRLERTR